MSKPDTKVFKDLEEEVEWRLNALERRHIPVSEDRLATFVRVVRESLNEFSVQLVEQQELRRLQNEKITTLDAANANLTQQVTMLSITVEDLKEKLRPQSEE